MARNKVEYHIPHTAFFTFSVEEGETLVAGDLVKITDDKTVGAAAAGDVVVGVVYAGTVGKSEYKGDDKDKVTVVINKPFVFLTASEAVTAGDKLEAADSKKVAVHDVGEAFAMAITSAVADGDVIIAVLL